MTFVFKDVNEFDYPVKINEPEKGRKVPREIKVTFAVISPERRSELVEDVMVARRGGDVSQDADARLCEEVVRGWSGVKLEDGSDFEFSDEALKKLIALPYVRSGIVKAYLDATNGEAKKGN